MDDASLLSSTIAWRSQIALADWTLDQSPDCDFACEGEIVVDLAGLRICADRAGRDRYDVLFPDLAHFRIDFDRRLVTVGTRKAADSSIIGHLIGNQIVPRILAHKGNLVVHAAALRSGAGAFLLVGPSGSGKSTLAASFYATGLDLLGDDAIKIVGDGHAQKAAAVYQSLRLHPDSLRSTLFGQGSWAPVAEGGFKQQALNLKAVSADGAIPVRSIFFLDPVPAQATAVTRVNAAETCFGLVENSFWLDVGDGQLLQRQIVKAGMLTAQIDSFRLVFPRDYDALPDVRAAILEAVLAAAQ